MRKLVIVGAAALAVTLGTASYALANADQTVSLDGSVRGEALFIDGGDRFRICDLKRDNLPVGVRYSYIRKNGTVQRGAHWHTAGVDGFGSPLITGFRMPGCSFGEHNFGEGRRVWYQACVRHAGGALTCSEVEVTAA
jgi:hypothetical protein